MKVTREIYEDYIRLDAQRKSAEKAQALLREIILEDLQHGGHSPKDLPYLVVLRTQMRTQFDWPGVVMKLLRRLLGSEKKAVARMAKIQSEFEVKEVPQVSVVINEEYAQAS